MRLFVSKEVCGESVCWLQQASQAAVVLPIAPHRRVELVLLKYRFCDLLELLLRHWLKDSADRFLSLLLTLRHPTFNVKILINMLRFILLTNLLVA